MILYTLYKNSYIDIAHLESTKGITCYVNSTNRCTCSCTFCLRQTKEMIENNSLWLKEEPTVDEIIQEFEKYNLNDFKEVVFCGFGEPLIRHDDLMKVAKYLKERRPDLPTRVNTNGLSSLYNKRDIAELFLRIFQNGKKRTAAWISYPFHLCRTTCSSLCASRRQREKRQSWTGRTMIYTQPP